MVTVSAADPVASSTLLMSKNFKSAVCTAPRVPVTTLAFAPAMSVAWLSATVTVVGAETVRVKT